MLNTTYSKWFKPCSCGATYEDLTVSNKWDSVAGISTSKIVCGKCGKTLATSSSSKNTVYSLSKLWNAQNVKPETVVEENAPQPEVKQAKPAQTQINPNIIPGHISISKCGVGLFKASLEVQGGTFFFATGNTKNEAQADVIKKYEDSKKAKTPIVQNIKDTVEKAFQKPLSENVNDGTIVDKQVAQAKIDLIKHSESTVNGDLKTEALLLDLQKQFKVMADIQSKMVEAVTKANELQTEILKVVAQIQKDNHHALYGVEIDSCTAPTSPQPYI